MPALTAPQLAQVANVITSMHVGMAAETFGMDAAGISQEVYSQLVNGGWVTPGQVQAFAMKAYHEGYAKVWFEHVATAPSMQVELPNVPDLYAAALKDGMEPPGPVGRAAVEFASHRGAQYIIGLGNRIANDFTTLAIETEHAQRAELQAGIKELIADTIIRQQTTKKLASKLGDLFDDWSRNLHRIAATELENAYQHGWADHWKAKAKGAEVLVGKRVLDTACRSCERLYTTAVGSPRVFTLSDLEANGSNFGRKQAEWMPVVGPTHPFCHCVLFQVPPGWGFRRLPGTPERSKDPNHWQLVPPGAHEVAA